MKGAIGEKNGNWKGDEAGITAIHSWIRSRKIKPDLCEKCGRKPTDKRGLCLHNIPKPKTYKRNVDDYVWVCFSCHSKLEPNGYFKFERTKEWKRATDNTGKKLNLSDEERNRRREHIIRVSRNPKKSTLSQSV